MQASLFRFTGPCLEHAADARVRILDVIDGILVRARLGEVEVEVEDEKPAPTEAEVAANPRARSAKLRAAVRTAAPAWGAFEGDILTPSARREWERLS
jgi:hypothetical protein